MQAARQAGRHRQPPHMRRTKSKHAEGASGGGKSAEGGERERRWLLLLPKVLRRQTLTWGEFKWHFQEPLMEADQIR